MKLSLPLPEPLIVAIEMHDQAGKRIVRTYGILPATRDQVKRALAMDLKEDVLDVLELEASRALQAEILTELSGLVKSEQPLELDMRQPVPCDLLAGEQCAQLARAVLHHHLGQDPAQAEAIHQVKKNAAILERLYNARRRSSGESNEPSNGSGSTEIPAPLPTSSASRPATPGKLAM